MPFIKQQGLTLIEVMAFIIVLGVMISGVFIAFQQVLFGSGKSRDINLAAQLAQQRMELILGQRYLTGYSVFSDPCPALPAVCTPPRGYAINVTFPDIADNNYQQINVQVTGPARANLTMRVANYDDPSPP